MDIVKVFDSFMVKNAEINIVLWKGQSGVYEIHDGYGIEGKAIWRVHRVYSHYVEFRAEKTGKIKTISYDKIAGVRSKDEFKGMEK